MDKENLIDEVWHRLTGIIHDPNLQDTDKLRLVEDYCTELWEMRQRECRP